MKSNKVIHHTGRDANVFETVEDKIEENIADIAAAEADIAAVVAEVDDLQAAVGSIANEDFQFLFALMIGEDSGSL